MPVDTELFTPGGVSAPGYRGAPETPRWMEDKGPEVPGRPIPGQMTLDVGPPALPLLTKAVTALTFAGLLYGMDHWARPMLKETVRPPGRNVFQLITWSLAQIQKLINPRMHRVTHEVSKGAAHNAGSATQTIGILGMRWQQLVWHVVYLAHDTANAIHRLASHTIPVRVREQVAPLKLRLHRVETRERRDYKQLTGLRVWTHQQITRVIKPQIRRHERAIHHDIPLRIRKEEIKRGRLEIRVKHDESLIHKLMPLLTTAGAAAIVLRAFSRLGLNMLRCQNTKDALRDLCASPPGSGKRLGRWLKDLLGMVAGGLFLSHICQVLELAVAAAAPIMTSVIDAVGSTGAALCDGKHSAAPALPLRAAALPSPVNPLPLG